MMMAHMGGQLEFAVANGDYEDETWS